MKMQINAIKIWKIALFFVPLHAKCIMHKCRDTIISSKNTRSDS